MFKNWTGINTLEVSLSVIGIAISTWAIIYTIVDRNKFRKRDLLEKLIKSINEVKSEMISRGKIADIKLDIHDSEEKISRTAIAYFYANELIDSTFYQEPNDGYSVFYNGMEDFEFDGKIYHIKQQLGKTEVTIGNHFIDGAVSASIPFYDINDKTEVNAFWLEMYTKPNTNGVFLRISSKDAELKNRLNNWEPLKKLLDYQQVRINEEMKKKLAKHRILKKYSLYKKY